MANGRDMAMADSKSVSSAPQRSETVAFWDEVYANTNYSRELNDSMKDALTAAGDFFQPHKGQAILDIGCGAGATSIYWAKTGADVTAIDHSETAINSLAERCVDLGITNIKPVVGDAMRIDQVGPFDFVFGAMILHHLEPFGDFVKTLKRSLNPGGKAFFYENNAASDVLVWFRNNVVGKFWVPKKGDKDEFPLTPQEVRLLREHFNVKIDIPEMMFFQLASWYLLKNRLESQMKSIDDFLYKRKIGIRYSYRQYVELEAMPALSE